jgi:hypothetical protein
VFHLATLWPGENVSSIEKHQLTTDEERKLVGDVSGVCMDPARTGQPGCFTRRTVKHVAVLREIPFC